jgi:hypothetical protein
LKRHWVKDYNVRIAREDRSGQGSANARQAVDWMAQVNEKDNAYYSPPTIDRWIVDCGASHHMTSQQDYIITYFPDSTTVTLVNNSIVKAAGRGDVVLLLPSGDITLQRCAPYSITWIQLASLSSPDPPVRVPHCIKPARFRTT